MTFKTAYPDIPHLASSRANTTFEDKPNPSALSLSLSLSTHSLSSQMSRSIAVDILSDDDDGDHHPVSTPLPTQSKRHKGEPNFNPTVFIIDDDPTPRKPAGSSSTPLFIPDTPMPGSSNSDVAIVKCTTLVSDPQLRSSSASDQKFSGICGLICLESDNESENGFGKENRKQNGTMDAAFDVKEDSEMSSRFINSSFSFRNFNLTQMCGDSSLQPVCSEDIPQAHDHPDEEIDRLEPVDNVLKQKGRRKTNSNKEKNADEAIGKNRMTKEERIHLMEEKKQQKEQEKLQKAALKAEAAEMKKLQKEKQKWEKGKFALKSIVAEIDAKVVELSVGGHLLTRFAEKGISYRIVSNPIERSITWTMTVPEEISQLSSKGIEIPYILLVYEAKEFCNLVMNESLIDHVSRVRSCYRSHTICYLTNRLMAYIDKREQEQYKNPTNCSSWTRPPVEEVLSKLTTHFVRVQSRQCRDEAELAEHVVGLTSSLASCQFRKKLTRLSVNANGSLIPNDCFDRNLIKKSLWLKALVAIPKVQPRFAFAIWKKYPTMKSLLSVYMDPSKSVHEKEFLLKDLTTEGLLSEDRRLGEICSKRVYRILMAQSGSIKTDDVEDGADFFNHQST
ncbi:crossover junction endonuclease EME1B-like [Cornus florida]|uniref:crossover junction endonuclease EME1B-like n=1 Tax=Cornus florida TaxID=4283 RepID=UPI00289743C9|nr:crossover junction endonuclease EME1B-like [Cornus florida]XP_059624412.1 crossover junction endonuclease EME1B-like [Cornus florida]